MDDGPAAPPPMPLWVKVAAVVGLIVALVFVAVLVLGQDHGPGRHSRSSADHDGVDPNGMPPHPAEPPAAPETRVAPDQSP